MIENEIDEIVSKHKKIIGSNIYKFEIVILKTKYFSEKNEILLKIIKNVTINNKKARKKDTEILVQSIRDDANKISNEYSQFDNFKTVKQHYVKDKIQKNWNKSNCLIFKISGQIIDNKIFDNTFSDTKLVDYNDINGNKKLFESKETYVKENTFDIFEKNYFVYLEDGIVTILEKFFEKIIEDNISHKNIEITDNKIINVISYFFQPYLYNRVKNYKNFANYIKENYKKYNAITNFFDNQLMNSHRSYKCFITNESEDIFNLTSDWIEYLFYSELYDECAYNAVRPCIMPYSPKNALFIIDIDGMNYFKKHPFDKEDFLLNTLLGLVDKRMNTSGDEKKIANEYYKTDTLIRLADLENKEYITNKFNTTKISQMVLGGDFKALSHVIVGYWRLKNIKNIREHSDVIKKIMNDQENNIREYFKKNGKDINEVMKELTKTLNNLRKDKD